VSLLFLPPIDQWKQRLEQVRNNSVADLPHRKAAVAIIIHEGPYETSILYIKRASHPKDPWSGQIGFPGGKVEEGETTLEAVIRECQEEISLNLSPSNLLGSLLPKQAYAYGKELNLKIYPHVFYQKSIGELQLDSNEVERIHTLSLKSILSPELITDYPYRENKVPAIKLENDFIWGLTYLITRDLINELKGLPLGYEDLLFNADHLKDYKRL
jgi:mutator protein MutT